nr:hypothetical transcript [Hymenolepis microstoma]
MMVVCMNWTSINSSPLFVKKLSRPPVKNIDRCISDLRVLFVPTYGEGNHSASFVLNRQPVQDMSNPKADKEHVGQALDTPFLTSRHEGLHARILKPSLSFMVKRPWSRTVQSRNGRLSVASNQDDLLMTVVICTVILEARR